MKIAMRMKITPPTTIHTHPSIPPSPLPLPDEDGEIEGDGDEEREED